MIAPTQVLPLWQLLPTKLTDLSNFLTPGKNLSLRAVVLPAIPIQKLSTAWEKCHSFFLLFTLIWRQRGKKKILIVVQIQFFHYVTFYVGSAGVINDISKVCWINNGGTTRSWLSGKYQIKIEGQGFLCRPLIKWWGPSWLRQIEFWAGVIFLSAIGNCSLTCRREAWSD